MQSKSKVELSTGNAKEGIAIRILVSPLVLIKSRGSERKKDRLKEK